MKKLIKIVGKTLPIGMILSTSISFAGEIHQERDLQTFLEDFHNDPAKVMNQLPVKSDSKEGFTFERKNDSLNILERKDSVRKSLMINEFVSEDKSIILSNDRAERLVDNGNSLINKLGSMDSKKLHSAKLSTVPWSDDYWAIRKGILAFRYADSRVSKYAKHSWKTINSISSQLPVDNYIQRNRTHLLSPSEKYDLLVGDHYGSLTTAMWSEGQAYYQKNGKVENWMGICHGWAPAAYMLDRPQKAISVKGINGHNIIFYPSDIKGLASLLWAKTKNSTKFIGGRCNVKNPKKDSRTGRIIDQKCFDTNPGTWHAAVVNQIGENNRSFVLDATYDYEVWNQPVYSYSYKYFNPSKYNGAYTSWKSARVKKNSFRNDTFRKYRNSKAKYIVGVEMVVKYIVETAPTHRQHDSSKYDALKTAKYRYDLEVDSRGKILGGEWYSNAHPDFLWTPPKGVRALSGYDKYTEGSWNINQKIPSSWTRVANQASRKGIPLAKVVEGLIKRAQ